MQADWHCSVPRFLRIFSNRFRRCIDDEVTTFYITTGPNSIVDFNIYVGFRNEQKSADEQ